MMINANRRTAMYAGVAALAALGETDTQLATGLLLVGVTLWPDPDLVAEIVRRARALTHGFDVHAAAHGPPHPTTQQILTSLASGAYFDPAGRVMVEEDLGGQAAPGVEDA